MKKICILLLCLIPLSLQNVAAESVSTTTSVAYPEVKTQIDKIFVTLEKKLAARTAEKQLAFYDTLISRIEAIQKAKPNLSAKNKFLLSYIVEKTKSKKAELESDEINLEDLFGGLDETETPQTVETPTTPQEEEKVIFTRKDFTQKSSDEEMMIGRFELDSEVKIEKLRLRLVSDAAIDFSGKQSIKIQRDDGINIALSSSITLEENSKVAVIEFSAPFYIQAGVYNILGSFSHIENKNYYTYVEEIQYGKFDMTYKTGEKKIALISVSREESKVDQSELTLSPLKYELDGIEYNIGAFTVSEETYFKNIELRVSANSAIGLEKKLAYILDESGSIYAKGGGYRQDGDIFYISFKNLVLKKGTYKINAAEDISESNYTRIETKIGTYLLNGSTSTTSKIYKGFVLSVVESK